MAIYERLMEAQHRIAAARTRAGVSDAEIDRALEASEPGTPESLSDEELYSATLAAFVAALGGRLSGSTAVFDQDTVALPRPEG